MVEHLRTNGKPETREAYLGMHDVNAEDGFVTRNITRYWRYKFNTTIRVGYIRSMNANVVVLNHFYQFTR